MNINIPFQVQLSVFYFVIYTIVSPYYNNQTGMIISVVGSMIFYGTVKALKDRFMDHKTIIRSKTSSIAEVTDLNVYNQANRLLEFDMGYNDLEVIK